MNKQHDSHRNILDESQLLPDQSFINQLQKQILKKEQTMKTPTNNFKMNWRSALIGAGSFAALGLLVFSLTFNQSQTVLAAELATNAQTSAEAQVAEVYKASQPGGTLVTVTNTNTSGPRSSDCTYLADDDISASTSYLYSTSDEGLEMYYRTETGPKRAQPVMVYDTNDSSRIIPQIVGENSNYVKQLLSEAEFVDVNGDPVDGKNTDLQLSRYNDNNVYRLFVSADDVCPDTDKRAIAEFVIDANNYNIYQVNTYIGQVNSSLLSRSRTVTTKVDRLNSEQALQTLEAKGFSKSKAEQNVNKFDESSILLEGYDVKAATGSSWSGLSGGVSKGAVSYSGGTRSDLIISGLASSANPASTSGLPIYGLKGFREQNNKYIDVYSGSTITADKLTAQRVNGNQVLTFQVSGAFEGEADKFVTVINTGNTDYPGLVIQEDYRQHFEHEGDWQLFINSLNF